MADMILKVGAMYCERCTPSVVSVIGVIGGLHYVTVSARHGEIEVGYDQAMAGAEQFERPAHGMEYKADEVPLDSIPTEVLLGVCLHTPCADVARYRAV